MNNALIAELQNEAASTRKLLERIPEDKFDFKPHEKSMSLIRLATHIAEVPSWIGPTLTMEEMDFAEMDYKPPQIKSKDELLKFFDENLHMGCDDLLKTNDMALLQNWTAKNKGAVVFAMPRIQVLRSMMFNHLYHHRGQLTVYLRLLNVPLPGIYGPTADETF